MSGRGLRACDETDAPTVHAMHNHNSELINGESHHATFLVHSQHLAANSSVLPTFLLKIAAPLGALR